MPNNETQNVTAVPHFTPELLKRMRWRVEAVDRAVAERAKYQPGSEEYAEANLAVARAIGDSHWIVQEHWRDLIAAASELTTERERREKAERERDAVLRVCLCPYCPAGCGKPAQPETDPAACADCQHGNHIMPLQESASFGMSDEQAEKAATEIVSELRQMYWPQDQDHLHATILPIIKSHRSPAKTEEK